MRCPPTRDCKGRLTGGLLTPLTAWKKLFGLQTLSHAALPSPNAYVTRRCPPAQHTPNENATPLFASGTFAKRRVQKEKTAPNSISVISLLKWTHRIEERRNPPPPPPPVSNAAPRRKENEVTNGNWNDKRAFPLVAPPVRARGSGGLCGRRGRHGHTGPQVEHGSRK